MALSTLDIKTGMESADQCGEDQTVVDHLDRGAVGCCFWWCGLYDSHIFLVAGLFVLLLGDRICRRESLHLGRRFLYAGTEHTSPGHLHGHPFTL